MKKLDIRSVLIGVLCTALVFVLIGATSQSENLGDIVVNSIQVLDDGTGGFISTHNADGIQTSYLGTGEGGGGYLKTYADGKETSFLGTSEGGFGFLKTFNKHGVFVGYFGSGKEQDGIISLLDRYGDIGWFETGKQ